MPLQLVVTVEVAEDLIFDYHHNVGDNEKVKNIKFMIAVTCRTQLANRAIIVDAGAIIDLIKPGSAFRVVFPTDPRLKKNRNQYQSPQEVIKSVNVTQENWCQAIYQSIRGLPSRHPLLYKFVRIIVNANIQHIPDRKPEFELYCRAESLLRYRRQQIDQLLVDQLWRLVLAVYSGQWTPTSGGRGRGRGRSRSRGRNSEQNRAIVRYWPKTTSVPPIGATNPLPITFIPVNKPLDPKIGLKSKDNFGQSTASKSRSDPSGSGFIDSSLKWCHRPIKVKTEDISGKLTNSEECRPSFDSLVRVKQEIVENSMVKCEDKDLRRRPEFIAKDINSLQQSMVSDVEPNDNFDDNDFDSDFEQLVDSILLKKEL